MPDGRRQDATSQRLFRLVDAGGRPIGLRVTRTEPGSPRSRWTFWAGIASILGGLAAMALTIPFAAAYFLAYPGFDAPPFWLSFGAGVMSPLLEFGPPAAVYETYGRVYSVVFLLYLPATVALHRLRPAVPNRTEAVGYALVVGALAATAIGVAGDYWADGIGYPVELLGLLLLAVSSTVWGVGVRRGGAVPRWWAWLLVAVGPLSSISLILLGHVPSGPAFPVAATWFLLGCLFVARRVGRFPAVGTSVS